MSELDECLNKWLDDDRMVRSLCETVAMNSPGAAAAMALVLKTYNARVESIEMLRVQVGRTEMALDQAESRCLTLEGAKDSLRARLERVRVAYDRWSRNASPSGEFEAEMRAALGPEPAPTLEALDEGWTALHRAIDEDAVPDPE